MTGSHTERLDELRSIAERVARSHGLELFDLQFRRETIGWVLRVFIDSAAEPASIGRLCVLCGGRSGGSGSRRPGGRAIVAGLYLRW